MIGDEASVMELPKPKALVDIESICGMRIRGSCNGLLLLNAGNNLFLWNPMTRCSKKVLSHERLIDSYSDDTIFGLCYDSSSDDYKAVMAATDHGGEFYTDKIVMAGSFKDKIWTEIRFPYKKGKVESGPTVNGRLHWLVSESTGKEDEFPRQQLIIYFDPLTNEFAEVPMPQCERGKNKKNPVVLGLGVLDGCLSFTLCGNCKRRDGSDVEVFTMREYGDRNSWTKSFAVSAFPGLRSADQLVPLRCTRKGLLLMLRDVSDNDIVVLAYNVGQGSLRSVCPIRDGGNVDVNVFVESLVSPLPNCNWEEEEYTEIYLSGVTKKWKRESGNSFTLIESQLDGH